ncbi:MAG: right-handed parallel beta-helix repeat-containing protein [Anaerolineales bacterium]
MLYRDPNWIRDVIGTPQGTKTPYSNLTTYYYVGPGGNDGNPGTLALPWLTLAHAFANLPAGAVLLALPGTFIETNGGGYWAVALALATWSYIASQDGVEGDAVVEGNASTAYNTFLTGSSAYLYFYQFKFTSRGTSGHALRITGPVNYVTFDTCAIIAVTGDYYGLYLSAATYDNLYFFNCTISGPAVGVYINGNGDASSMATFRNCTIQSNTAGANFGVQGQASSGPTPLTFDNCTINDAGAGGGALQINGGAVTLTGCLLSNTGAYTCVCLGADADNGGYPTTISMIGCTVSKPGSAAGHAVCIGSGVSQGLIDSLNSLTAYDYGLVIKECTNVEVRNSNIIGAAGANAQAAVLFKGATGQNVHNNNITALGTNPSGNWAVKSEAGGTGDKNANWSLTHNVITAIGPNAQALNLGGASADAGGGVCDYNTYILKNGASLGTVYGTVVNSLAQLQAAWAGYSNPGNDAHSVVIFM